jgi:hypothetical protein
MKLSAHLPRFGVIVIFAAIKPRFRASVSVSVGRQEKSGARVAQEGGHFHTHPFTLPHPPSSPFLPSYHFSTLTQLMTRGPRLRLRT